eukprot:TRINITY_DN68121_c1_g2_i2.p1 TRINITY_DN68121_c1_g2~~TRINITY_DN68121_c1_g2_i2.p1  ORF type:complete len:137 (+),score=11.98 TRINITY_DN68121_c1_g2_i2:61-471(+)
METTPQVELQNNTTQFIPKATWEKLHKSYQDLYQYCEEQERQAKLHVRENEELKKLLEEKTAALPKHPIRASAVQTEQTDHVDVDVTQLQKKIIQQAQQIEEANNKIKELQAQLAMKDIVCDGGLLSSAALYLIGE